jgi:hypothetical protein
MTALDKPVNKNQKTSFSMILMLSRKMEDQTNAECQGVLALVVIENLPDDFNSVK